MPCPPNTFEMPDVCSKTVRCRGQRVSPVHYYVRRAGVCAGLVLLQPPCQLVSWYLQGGWDHWDGIKITASLILAFLHRNHSSLHRTVVSCTPLVKMSTVWRCCGCGVYGGGFFLCDIDDFVHVCVCWRVGVIRAVRPRQVEAEARIGTGNVGDIHNGVPCPGAFDASSSCHRATSPAYLTRGVLIM